MGERSAVIGPTSAHPLVTAPRESSRPEDAWSPILLSPTFVGHSAVPTRSDHESVP